MATRADDLIDRRRLRRKLTFWRIAALAIAALAIVAASAWIYGDEFGGAAIDHVARIEIEGTITEDQDLLELLDDVRKSSTVKGVILSIDSPGGTTAGLSVTPWGSPSARMAMGPLCPERFAIS